MQRWSCKRESMIREWESGEQAFQYEERNKEITVLQWKGNGTVVQRPERIEGAETVKIGRKAFLSNKRIQEVSLPGGIREIDDWAFAYCSRLACVYLPRREILFGKGAFLQCEKLEQMVPQTEDGTILAKRDMTSIGGLLAAVVHKLDDPYLLNPLEAGSQAWIQRWDVRMLQVLHTPDRDGYQQTILCGEEDIGSMENNLDYFLSQKRRSKARLALLRLLYDMGLEAKTREELQAYIKSHTKGCAHEEAWRVVREEYGNRKEFYDMLLDCGALTETNFDSVLCDMGTELAEMKAYLLKEKEARFSGGGFFDSLSLD